MNNKIVRLARTWPSLLGAFFFSLGAIFLVFESYEVITNSDIKFSFASYLIWSGVVALIYSLVDGHFVTGNLLGKIDLFQNTFGSKVTIKFGDLFSQSGWKAISVNDFFDHQIDDVLISSSSLHGHVVNTYWPENNEEWYEAVIADLSGHAPVEEARPTGKTLRYPIGATAKAESESEKFLFVALGNTSIDDNTTTATAEDLICAVRGLLRKARAVCSNQPLSIPLMGSGLARVGIINSVVLDLILCGVFEELKQGKITSKIQVVLPESMEDQIDLLSIKRKWH
ncbi:MAG: hypothetical protein K1563_17545 [Candidatus Thiodiazotropha sp. (ex. Lucinisca nassula)]|nr:hypothetical protein [Candidatus Thiodiazotropha sp. (ex. Lucinisca nassula)]MBW9275486.1 hypothetical protein [Candidatus Thiodiazotropha sp. (ex. Lucinisca nassula)]